MTVSCLLWIGAAILFLGHEEQLQHEVQLQLQHEEQLQDYKRELADVNSKLFTLNAEDSDDLVTQHAHLEQELFATSLQIKKEMEARSTPSTTMAHPSTGHKGVKFLKLEIPTFNGKCAFLEKLLGTVFDLGTPPHRSIRH